MMFTQLFSKGMFSCRNSSFEYRFIVLIIDLRKVSYGNDKRQDEKEMEYASLDKYLEKH